MRYEARNLATLKELAPRTYAAAMKVYAEAKKHGIEVLIYDARRTLAEQKANVAKGVSATLKSYHLVGQAFDVVPVDKNGAALWNGYGSASFMKFVASAKKHGFTWGGDWKGFVDCPHFQFEYKGYGTDEKEPVAKAPVAKPKVVKKAVAETFTVEVHKGQSKADAYKLAEFAEKLGFDAIVVKE